MVTKIVVWAALFQIWCGLHGVGCREYPHTLPSLQCTHKVGCSAPLRRSSLQAECRPASPMPMQRTMRFFEMMMRTLSFAMLHKMCHAVTCAGAHVVTLRSIACWLVHMTMIFVNDHGYAPLGASPFARLAWALTFRKVYRCVWR